MADLSVNFMGLKLKNPLLLAPGMYNTAVGWLPKFAPKIAENGWAGVVTKPLQTDDFGWGWYSYPCLFSVEGTTPMEKRLREAQFLVNGGPGFEFVSERKKEDVKAWMRGNLLTKKQIKEAIKIGHDHGLVIIGCLEPTGPKNAALLAEIYQECGFDGIDFNPSCPMISDFGGGTWAIGLYPEKVEEITRSIKEHCTLPVIVKLSPHLSDYSVVARAAVQGGADAVSGINTFLSIIGIDVETGDPLSRPNSGGPGVPMGLSGPAILPIGLRTVWEIARSVSCDICGIGGIYDWKTAVEYIMVGATAVQICTAVMFRGLRVGKEILQGINDFMDRKGYKTIDDFKGISVSKIMPFGKQLMISSRPSVSVINKELCTGCGRCIISCSDNSGDCIKLVDHQGKKVAEVDDKNCTGCGLCACVCPVPGCISFKTIPVSEFRMAK